MSLRVINQKLYEEEWGGEDFNQLLLYFHESPEMAYQLNWSKRLGLNLNHPYWSYGNVLVDIAFRRASGERIVAHSIGQLLKRERAIVPVSAHQFPRTDYDDDGRPNPELLRLKRSLPDEVGFDFVDIKSPLFKTLSKPLSGMESCQSIGHPRGTGIPCFVRQGSLGSDFMSFDAFDSVFRQLEEQVKAIKHPTHSPFLSEWSPEFRRLWTLPYRLLLMLDLQMKLSQKEAKLLSYLILGYPLESLWVEDGAIVATPQDIPPLKIVRIPALIRVKHPTRR